MENPRSDDAESPGNDVGTQYRSAIFYHDEEQKKLAESYKRKLDAEHIWDHPIVTEIVPYQKFWPAEDYHQNYYNANSGRSYCQLVINPKLAKLKKVFAGKLKQLKLARIGTDHDTDPDPRVVSVNPASAGQAKATPSRRGRLFRNFGNRGRKPIS